MKRDMPDEPKNVVALDRPGDLSPRVSFLFSMMEKTRNRLLRVIEELPDETIDFTPDVENVETIGTLLLHIAGVEWSWIFEDIDGEEMDYERWKYAFPLRENLTQLTGNGKQFYIDRLHEVRKEIRQRLREMDDSSLHQLVDIGHAEVTVEWILFHLMEHEAMHIGQISILNRLSRNQ